MVNVGPIPTGMSVLHHCDNPACVRPDHIYLGTYVENMADKAVRGRVPGTRLTPDIVRDLRSGGLGGRSIAQAGRDYGVSESAIRWALSGRTWMHV